MLSENIQDKIDSINRILKYHRGIVTALTTIPAPGNIAVAYSLTKYYEACETEIFLKKVLKELQK